MSLQKIIDNKVVSLFILLSFHFLFRIILLSIDAFPFNSDEAIVGLMAKHIIDGESFLYFYGQSYMGSLDAYLVALGFLIFGEEIWVIRFVQIFIYGLTIIFIYLYVDLAFRNKKIAFISSVFLIFPTINVVLYTTVSLGGYGEAILLGVLSFYLVELFLKDAKKERKINNKILGLLGLISGFGLYINPISLTMIIPACIYLVFIIVRLTNYKIILKKILPVFLGCFIIGSFLFYYSLFVSNGYSALNEIGGSAVAVEKVPFITRSVNHLISFILFGPSVIMGLRPPWGVEWITIYLIPIIIIFWVFVSYLILLSIKKQNEYSPKIISLLGIMAFVISGFIFTSFGIDPSGRYFLPFFFPMSVFAGFIVISYEKKLLTFIVVLVLFYQLYGVFHAAFKVPYITTQFYSIAQVNHKKIGELKTFLLNEEEHYGFSNYWVSYPLAFISDERILAIPKLPYHNDLRYTERDNRISKYNDMIKNGDNYFYITTNNNELDNLLIQSFKVKSVTYSYKEIGDYHIFYNLSKKITPEELGIDKEFN
jgi:4-amino-4-deoxy-L-arabinose transferase-like glycosyltransferase